MRGHLTRLAWAALGLLVATTFLYSSEPTEKRPEPPPPSLPEKKDRVEDRARNSEPSFLVRAALDRFSQSYREGDSLRISVASEKDAYLYVFYQPAEGEPYKIFPTRFQPNHRVKARQVVEIPGKDDLFRWRVGPPFGQESVKVIATKTPLKSLSAEELNSQRFNPVSEKLLDRVEQELSERETSDWAETDVEIYTYPKGESERPAGSRRFGVFFGVSRYKYNEQYSRASEGKHELNLPTAALDASALGQLFGNFGRLNDFRVYVDEAATRQQIEQSVTQWLPSVSRPGDTVFFFFSGHGMKIVDDNGDETDGFDEALTPSDTVDLGILAEFIEDAKEGKPVDPRYEQLLQVARRAGEDLKKMNASIIRETAVSDDLFARWLQRLDGRKVVIILHTCHSGGFATIEKGATPRKTMFQFDYLDDEAGRLKDIGQTNQALFAASMSSQVSWAMGGVGNMKLSVMPHFLGQILIRPGGPITLKQAYDTCKEEMTTFFMSLDPERKAKLKDILKQSGIEPEGDVVQTPYLINNIEGEVFLRP